MTGPAYRACKQCNFLSENDTCPRCGGQTSKEWQGFIAVVDFEKSDIARRMGITANGRYALKVR
ncbi:MAG: DNA-directed RNA polymerase, subunit E'' [Candidatus Methanoplasma sp.]|jgi:DNA-directed RNA polymerase subunit E"|nr:DNA-directed RNA polymerase, subunit E'' [Candidatus Methanoplasma sp.]